MAYNQQKVGAVQPSATTKANPENERKAAADRRRVHDALEDDEVRESLEVLHSCWKKSEPG
jgi:hypothetical protein